MNGFLRSYLPFVKDEGCVALCFFDINNSVKLTACLCTKEESERSLSYYVNGNEGTAVFFHSILKNNGQSVCFFRFFEIELSLDEVKNGVKISFEKDMKIYTFSAFPIDSSACSFYQFENSIMYLNATSLFILPQSRELLKERKRATKRAKKYLFKNDRSNFIKAEIMRIANALTKPFFKKDIWLIFDRRDVAGDNGQAFFEYVVNNTPKNVKPYFVISRSSTDYKKMKRLGKTLSPRTFKYKLYYTHAKFIIGSQMEYDIVNPILARDYLKDILSEQRIVFLQHGIIKDDLSPTYNRYTKPMDIFITSTADEYSSIVGSAAYGYRENIVKLTGLARYDKLKSNSEKIIFIAPSWRRYCLKDTDSCEPVDNIKETGFFKLYNSLLHSERLINTASAQGYRLCYFPHFMLRKCTDFFGKLDPVFINGQEFSYTDVFEKGDMLITDYSSIQFDFAYLKKPVLYCQADRDEFFGAHTYIPGYFSYEKNGFGEVTYGVDELISLLCEYIEKGCVLKDKYLKRINDTFKYTDKNNCKRILDEVLLLNGKS